ncbi:MAG TPA: energy transducer TonB [Pyrinomonadaceae bacterium]|nr:energy transducer TonB [Pyrinomonadaceae bacterium]
MKQCQTCGEIFDQNSKFLFCPVDGSPLNGAAAPAPEPFAADEPSLFASAPPQVTEQTAAAAADSQARAEAQSARVEVEPQTTATVAAAAAASSGAHFAASSETATGNGSSDTEQTVVSAHAAPEREEYHLTMLEDAGLTTRLRKELSEVAQQSQLTWPEFKKDPVGFAERTAVGYGLLAKKFFRQPYVPASILAGVLGMALAVTLLVFPFKTVYKWLMSDGQLVADVGMSLGDVRQRSSLQMGEPVAAAPDAQVEGEEATTVATLSGDNLGFDFDLGGTGIKFEWARAYRLVLENDRVREINVEVSSKPQSWQQLKTTALQLAEFLEDKQWRSGRTESGITQAAVLKARFQEGAAVPAELQQPDVREFLWRDQDNLRQLTFTAAPLQEGVDPKSATYAVYLKVEEIPQDMLATLIEIPKEQPEPDEGPAGMAKGKGGGSKPKQEKPGGGGGGGRQEQLPASYGKLPPAVLAPQILPPNPHPPTIKNPSLPVTPTIDADPALFPTDNRPIPYGDPKSTSTVASAGPGTGGGIGDGTGGGVGPGDGGGVGPGRGGNTGGGDRNEGGGGPGGGGGGGTDYTRTFSQREVTRKAILTFKPEPGFTEEARKNQVTGVVRLKMVLGANGGVSSISVVKGLPDGLTERAIAAARRIQFQPAQKDGRPVSQWITIEYTFNIY